MTDKISDPNCIVKAFEKNDITILQKENEYYFKASDVADALEITNIYRTIQNYTLKERVVQKCLTLGGPQDVVFLTSRGVYRLLFSSKKKVAEQFREWVGDIMDDIIFNQSKKLKEQLELKEKEHQEQMILINQKIEELENRPETVGFSTKQYGYVYLAHDTDKKGHLKIGMTNDINKRNIALNGSSSTYSIIMVKFWKTNDKNMAEKLCHMILEPLKIKTRHEWFYVKNDNELSYVIDTIEKSIKFISDFHYKDVQTYNDMLNNMDVNLSGINLSKDYDFIISKNKQSAQKLKARAGLYKGVCFNENKCKWQSNLKYNGLNNFLGYHENEKLAGIAYNDYALYLNTKNEDCNYSINEIDDYIPNPRNIPEDNKLYNDSLKTSKYIGLTYIEKNKVYQVSIKYNNIYHYLGKYKNEEDGAKVYNKQAIYFNNHFNTKYELNTIENYENIEENIIESLKDKKFKNKSSKYTGVIFSKQAKKWHVYIYSGKQHYLGAFVNQIDAAKKYNEKAIEFNKKLEFENKKRRYKLNVFE